MACPIARNMPTGAGGSAGSQAVAHVRSPAPLGGRDDRTIWRRLVVNSIPKERDIGIE